MNKIRVEINPTTNYVFHMLSAAEVGYDNDYGRKWRHTLPAADVAVLQKHRKQLTVKGGEHCGEWYGPLVCQPAQALQPADEFYRSVTDPAMAEVCGVMAAHYQDYLTDVFPETLRELQPYANELQRLLDESSFADRAEALVGGSQPVFRVMLVNSVAGGPEGIDISPEQDVFGIGRTPREKMLFIEHEYVIYLLKQVLQGTAAFQTMETWRITEGLAEYYLARLCGGTAFAQQMQDVVAFYQQQEEGLSAREKYLRAEAWELLRAIARAYHEGLGENLTGVYVHGSMAFGCYRPEESDLDFLVVVEHEPTDEQKLRLLEILLALNAYAPAKGFEMSVVLAKDCAAPVHPIPFCLHYSNAHREAVQRDAAAYIGWMKGVDPDLAAHFTVTRAVGKAVWGKPIEEVFGAVPREAYLHSILADVAEAETDVADNPVYVILNLCRVLAALREGAVLSKAQGGAWGLEKLPEAHHAAIRAALDAYQKGAVCQIDGRAFARYASDTIKEEAAWNR